jgi:hypothetical protein
MVEAEALVFENLKSLVLTTGLYCHSLDGMSFQLRGGKKFFP